MKICYIKMKFGEDQSSSKRPKKEGKKDSRS